MAESLKIVDILDKELAGSVVDYWRLTLHTPTLDVNFEGYGDIPWNLIKAGLSEIEGINSLDEILNIPVDVEGLSVINASISYKPFLYNLTFI